MHQPISTRAIEQPRHDTLPHVGVCVCAYRRPEMLVTLLNRLGVQKTDDLFSYSIAVVDNDENASGRDVCAEFRRAGRIAIAYDLYPVRNLAMVRNRVIGMVRGTYVALIDDDEFPAEDWLLQLFKACRTFQADGVLGPVRPHFLEPPPSWIEKGRFHEKGHLRTGTILTWFDTRTSNVLLQRRIFDDPRHFFDPRFDRQGEDVDFFARLIESDHTFVWCNEAIVFENIPPRRTTRTFLLRSAYDRGRASVRYRFFDASFVLKSIVVIPVYALGLVGAAVLPHHVFMHVFVRLVEHAGRIAAVCWPSSA